MELDPKSRQMAVGHLQAVLELLDPDPDRPGLRDTPARILKAWMEMTSGYDENPAEILSRTFDIEGSYDEMVLVRDIPFWSLCEHHLLPFSGVAHVAYIPEERVVGLSKIPRLVECFARRLQLQERLTHQISSTIHRQLGCMGVGVVVEAVHTCMAARGVRSEGKMKTSALSGVFMQKPGVREEFFNLIEGRR